MQCWLAVLVSFVSLANCVQLRRQNAIDTDLIQNLDPLDLTNTETTYRLIPNNFIESPIQQEAIEQTQRRVQSGQNSKLSNQKSFMENGKQLINKYTDKISMLQMSYITVPVPIPSLFEEPALSIAFIEKLVMSDQQHKEFIDNEMEVMEVTQATLNEQPSSTLLPFDDEEESSVFVFIMPTDDQMKQPEEIEYENHITTENIQKKDLDDTPKFDKIQSNQAQN